jgi:hypothetical protein
MDNGQWSLVNDRWTFPRVTNRGTHWSNGFRKFVTGRHTVCERCGEIGETFMTEEHGDLCEGCQREAEKQKQRSPMQRMPKASKEE